MNILGHIAIGVTGSLIADTPLFFIASIIPDIVLIPNEINLLIKGKEFNKHEVTGKIMYDISHSLLMVSLLIVFTSPVFYIGYLLHILVDIPFHTSSFRWKPILLSRWKPKKRAVLLSGGMDSVAAAWIELDKKHDYDLIYFNYGQEYHTFEYKEAQNVAKVLNKDLIVINKQWHHDIENRNYYLIAEIKKLGYDEVITGNRNLLPIFDKYGDSNWINLKLYQYLLGIYINMPLIGLFKSQVKSKLKNSNLTYFSSEKWNKKI